MTTRSHRVHPVHRLGSAVLGMVLLAYGAIGSVRGALSFRGAGDAVWGLSTNGALTVACLAVGLLLVVAAAWGGPTASTLSASFGVVLVVVGLVHLALLHTAWNVLDFRLSSILFTVIVGMLMLFLGFYGRVSGGLPPDNDYRRSHPIKRHRPDPDEQIRAEETADEHRRMERAELSVAEGTATPEQARLVQQERARNQAEQRRRAEEVAEERRGDGDSR